MYSIDPEITKEYLLEKLSQEQIMEHYLGLPIKTSHKFCSPFRKDKNPSCSLSYRKGKLHFKDFGSTFKGDCFDIAMHVYQVSYWEALKLVAKDFNLIDSKLPPVERKEYDHLAYERENDTPTEIKLKVRKWVKADKKFWFDKYHITRKTLKKFNVHPVQVVWLNDNIIYNDRPESDPCYAYRLAKGQYKLYFPLRKRSDNRIRFIHNTQKVQGYRQLPQSGKYLVMTKSMKDVMVLDKFDIPAIALISETVYPPEKLIPHLRTRFEHIISLYDFDYAGIHMANYLKRKYGITISMLDPVETGAKDIADYIEVHGVQETKELIEFMRGHFDSYFEDNLIPSDEITY